MDALALLLAALAAFAFLVDVIDRRRGNPPSWVFLQSLGLLLLTVALICQFTNASGHTVS